MTAKQERTSEAGSKAKVADDTKVRAAVAQVRARDRELLKRLAR